MTKSVADAALLLQIMAGRDRADRSTASADRRRADYANTLSPDALRGARLGVWRPRRMSDASFTVFDAACEAMRKQGAELVALEKFRTPKGLFANEFEVFLTELKSGLNAYLATTPAAVVTRTLADVVAFNKSEPRELALFGQDLFEAAEATRGLDDETYKKALASSRRMARKALDSALSQHRLDAIVTITAGPSWRIDLACGDGGSGESSTLPAVAGYPHLTLPMGDVMGLPVGMSFIGPAWSEARLLALGHALERVTQARKMPKFLPTLEAEAKKEFARVAPSL
jgi:amidase